MFNVTKYLTTELHLNRDMGKRKRKFLWSFSSKGSLSLICLRYHCMLRFMITNLTTDTDLAV